jgi:hypothetical protein
VKRLGRYLVFEDDEDRFDQAAPSSGDPRFPRTYSI